MTLPRTPSVRRRLRAAVEACEPRRLLASVSGTVFYDDNLNGTVDGTSENGQAGWGVYVDANNNGTRDGTALNSVSADVPKTISDNSTVLSNLPVAAAGVVADVDVTVNLTHTYTGDLELTLVSPSGTRVILSANRGGGGNNFTNTVFDDGAAASITSITSAGGHTGSYRPEQPLSNVAGQPLAGTWQLEVRDEAGGDVGTLDSWSLFFRDGELGATTSATGAYTIAGLAAGTHVVRVEPQTGYAYAPASRTVSLASATTALSGQNFGVRQPPGAVSGLVFGDYDADGVRDAGEPGLAGRTVYLDTDDDSQLEAGERSTTTIADGTWAFPDARPGSYQVRAVLPNRWLQTTPVAGNRPGAALGVSAPSNELSRDVPVMTAKAGELVVAVSDRARLDKALAKNANSALKSALKLTQAAALGDVGAAKLLVVPLANGVDPEKLSDALARLAGVQWAQPNFVYSDASDPREYTPNDPSFATQYHHVEMQNATAWNTTEGAGVKIGIADDGVLTTHPDLAPNVHVNTSELANNNLDDDANGYVDDVNGWDFTNSTGLGTGDRDPNPVAAGNDHGTHVAGIAAARTNNGVGVSGTAGKATIVPLRFYGTGNWTSTVIFNTYKYAADNGVKIVSTSYNVDGFANDSLYASAVQYLYDNNVLHLNSAGNNGAANPARQVYGQSIYVASTDDGDGKSGFSNWGTGIDLSAPGGNVYSTAIGSALTAPNYEYKGGTSMATPNAAGVAALIWAAHPTWTRDQVAAQLLGTADNIDALNATYATLLGTGRANSLRGVTETLAAPKLRGVVGLPDEGASTLVSPTSVRVRFLNVLSPATVNTAGTFKLVGAGADDQFGTSDDLTRVLTAAGTAQTSVYRVATNELTLNVAQPLTTGTWRFVVESTATDPFGRALDGNGDGTGGDDFTRTFTVAGITAAAPVVVASGSNVTGVLFGQREVIPPTVESASFAFETGQRVTYVFSEDVAPPTTAALQVVNTTTNAPLPASSYALAYTAATKTLTVTFNSALPDGDYEARVLSAQTRDRYGNQLDGDANGGAGGDYALAFFFLNGDFNRDRAVGFADLAVQASNYGSATGQTFSDGDADYDGDVDFADLAVLAARYGVALPPTDAQRATTKRVAADVLV